jgi:tetratricopeptide (TPR) repeat protein
MAISRALLLVLLLLWSASAARADPVACSTPTDTSPNELEAQLKLVDALIDQGCYKEALPVLQAGLAQRPRSSEIQSRMRAVNSMLSEQRFFEGLGTAQETAKLQHALMRCTKAFDLAACDEALRSKPDDPQLLVAKADALAHAGKPAEAIAAYQRAATLLPGDDTLESKLADAEKQRQSLISQCQGAADAPAAEACQAALLPGSPEEFSLLRRRGIVLQSIDQPKPALDAFIAANALVPNDQSVALSIIALTDSTGRKDAIALAARGTSLLALGHPTEALQTLHQAETLAPALPNIKSELAQAEQAAHLTPKPHSRTASATPRPGTSARTSATTNTAVPNPNIFTSSHPSTTAVSQPGAAAPPKQATYSNDATAARTN